MSVRWPPGSKPESSQHHRPTVAFLLPHLGGGGVERVFTNYAAGFAAKGVSTDLVLVSNRHGATSAPKGVRVVNLGVWASGDATLGLALPALIRYLRRERPAALCIGITTLNLTALVARRLSGVNTTVLVSEHVPPSVNAGTHPLKRLLPPLMRWWYPKADVVFAVSEFLAADVAAVARLPRERVATVHNPVVGEKLLAEAAKMPDHPFFGGADKVIVAVGRLHPQKDFLTLIRAFHLLQQQLQCKLVILGEGEQRRSLEAEVARLGLTESVALPGHVGAPGSYLAHADLFALSSQYEGFPTVLIEALACGCPVVSTDCPTGPHEILEGGRFGPLVAVGDPAALAEAMRATLQAPLAAATLMERGRTFSIEAATDRLLGVIEQARAARQDTAGS